MSAGRQIRSNGHADSRMRQKAAISGRRESDHRTVELSAANDLFIVGLLSVAREAFNPSTGGLPGHFHPCTPDRFTWINQGYVLTRVRTRPTY